MGYEHWNYPQLSWSFSKTRLIEECLLKYYYQTYGGHNGWLKDAPPEVRKIYLLKNLKAIDALYGEIFHSAVKGCLDGAIPVKTPASLRRYIKEHIQSSYKQSLSCKADWERYPKAFAMISEAYYSLDIVQKKKEAINQKTKLCSENLFLNNTFLSITGSHKYEILELDELRQFNFDKENIVCYVKIDTLIKEKATNRYIIVDWKTSLSPSPSDASQLLSYAYYVSSKYGVPAEMIEGRLEYVAMNKTQVVNFRADDMDRFVNYLEFDINKIKEFIVPGTQNQPVNLEQFKPNVNRQVCSNCNFRQICKANKMIS